MDLPKKQLRNMNGRNMTRGVFKAYAVSLCHKYAKVNIAKVIRCEQTPNPGYKSCANPAIKQSCFTSYFFTGMNGKCRFLKLLKIVSSVLYEKRNVIMHRLL